MKIKVEATTTDVKIDVYRRKAGTKYAQWEKAEPRHNLVVCEGCGKLIEWHEYCDNCVPYEGLE